MMKRAQGFTLLEVVVAISILAFLSLFTVQAIQRAIQTKAKVQKEIDKTSTMRDALRIMERDINMAFNYHDVGIALYNMAQQQRQKTAQQPKQALPGQTGNAPLPGQQNSNQLDSSANDPNRFKQKVEKVYTQFVGEPSSLALTTLSNVRMMEESKISSQAEVAYTLKSCRRRSNQEASSQCLWRRIANYLHDDITHEGDGQSTVLLENVTAFKLRYLGPGREEEWVDTWITNERGDDQTKNKFPYAVEITLEVKDPSTKVKDKPLRMTLVAAIRNPNNPPNPNDPKDPSNATPNNQPQGVNADQTNLGNGQITAPAAPLQNGVANPSAAPASPFGR